MTSSTTDRRLGLSGNTAIKTPCKAATTAAITLSGEQTIDSVACVTGDRVLVKNQSTGSTNGIYVVDTGSWTRDLDFDGTNDFRQGTLVLVTQGSANGAGLFELTSADPLTIDSSTLTFTKIATLAASSVTQANVQNGQFVALTSVAGTNTITGTTVGTAPSANGSGQYVFFIPANTNTGAATLNRDSLGALSIFYNGAALIGGELQANIPALLYEDGTQYQLIATAAGNTNYKTRGTVASASTINLDTAGPYSQITGTTGISTITLGNGRMRFVEFAGAVTLTNSSTLITTSGANITTAAGSCALFVGEAASVVRMLFYTAGPNGSSATTQPTRQVLTSGTAATYTTPTGCTRINVRMIGGGSGGNGSGTGSPGLGTAGGNTTFSTLTASGGAAPAAYQTGGVGGAASGGDINIPGGNGQGGGVTGAGISLNSGGQGGVGAFGGAGGGGSYGGAGSAAATNSGSGGGGGGSNAGSHSPAAGGASGGYVEKLITAPSATYTYTVGAKGTGGTAGTSGYAGGDGAAGIIIVDEYYN